jgi:hypothetical protein
METKKYTKEELVKKYGNKFIDTYPYFYEKMDNEGNWVTVYEVRGVSSKIRENYNPPQELED